MYQTGLVEELVKNGPVSHKGFVFLADGLMVGCLVRVYLFCPGSTLLKGSRFKLSFLGLPCAFHCAVILHYL